MRGAEDCLKQIINKLLQCSLGGQQPGQVDLRHQLVGPLVVLLIVCVVSDQVPHLDTRVVVVVER